MDNGLMSVLLITFGAGAGGTLLGGVLGVLFKKPSSKYIGLMLGFSAGIMLGVSLFELMPEAYEYGGLTAAMVGFVIGGLFVFGLDFIAEKYRRTKESAKPIKGSVENKDFKKLFKTGLIIFFTVMLHTFPEGVAIGAGEHLGMGVVLALVLMVHNIPEGLAFALPLRASGVKVWKVLGVSFLAGVPMVFGGIIGYLLGMNDLLIAYALSFAAGAMIYVVFGEMLATAYEYCQNHKLLTLISMLGTVIIILFASII